MNKCASILKPLMPILATAYGMAIIYVTAMPTSGDGQSFVGEVLTWLLTLAAIALTLFLVFRVEPKLFTAASQFPLKRPKFSVFVGFLMLAPLWLVVEGYIVYGLTSLVHAVSTEPVLYSGAELREDLLASVHAVLLAPVLEELCFRQMALSPFRRRGAMIAVCIVMALLFGMVHVRNFAGAFLSAMLYGMVFIGTRNIWYSVALHAGHNLAATLLAVYCWLGIGNLQMMRLPVVVLADWKIVVGGVILAAIGYLLIKAKR